MNRDDVTHSKDDRVTSLNEEVTELALLLSGHDATQLERIAASRGLTVAGLIRRLIQDYLEGRSICRRITG
jgi:hypothetical protein